jgi:hypothetical protein
MMSIASFSPVLHRTSSLSLLLSPVQALIAFFVPAQPASIDAQAVANPALCHPTSAPSRQALNGTHIKPSPKRSRDVRVQRLKIVRQFEPGASRSCAGRLVISGRMSDVCAELERMAG